ncbi:hypothetical protein [Dactylosporangium sp. CS-033363]|uniref:hypothetical protein n=1 Tax=Dactylosporangium sp. CS-033363 TaxID=3239935 RepID=UPI003D93A8EE
MRLLELFRKPTPAEPPAWADPPATILAAVTSGLTATADADPALHLAPGERAALTVMIRAALATSWRVDDLTSMLSGWANVPGRTVFEQLQHQLHTIAPGVVMTCPRVLTHTWRATAGAAPGPCPHCDGGSL